MLPSLEIRPRPWKVDLTVRQRVDNPALIEHIDRVGVPFSVAAES